MPLIACPRSFLPLASVAALLAAQTPVPSRISADAVINHIERTIAWYHRVNSVEQSAGAPGNILLRGNTYQSALRTLQLAFDFARADAALESSSKTTGRQGTAPATPSATAPGASSRNLQQVASRAAGRVTEAQTRLSALDAALAKAKPRDRDALQAQRKELEAELSLAKEIQKTVASMASFASAAGNSSGPGSGLAGQIAELERTVPEAGHNEEATPAATAKPAATKSRQAPSPPSVRAANSEGLISLGSDLVSLHSSIADFNSLLAETDALIKNVNVVRSPLVNGIRDSIRQSDQFAGAPPSTDVAALTAHQQQISAFAAQFRQISTVLVPLGEQQIMAETTRGDLAEWKDTIAEQYGAVLHAFLVRAGTLIAAIVFILIISSIWRHAALRYVSDARHRRGFLLLRRVVVVFAIVLVLLLSVVSHFGSFATYAGFLTAGLALALQNVILSVVAYFFLIGRYGVRVGDRVTIAGVNGEVIDMGLVRLYMMELAGPATDLHATGRIVVYSNAVIFQPAAIYKQMPGITYAWHSATLTLTPESDFEVAEKALTAAVDSVYDQYRGVIEKQVANLRRSVEMDFPDPKPQGHLHFSETGLEWTVRYPVESNRGPEIDAKVIQSLTEAINKEPKLTLAVTGGPKLDTGAGGGGSAH